MLSRQDAVELSKQVAGLERQVRELKRELEQRSEPAHEPGRHDGTRAGRAGSPKAV
jgi:hypothetical protein